MRLKLLVLAGITVMSVWFAIAPIAMSAGCATTKTDSMGTTCTLQSETVDTCLYYNDSAHCSRVGMILQ
jgi:hypothetical protein